jgi:hypothetical protein
MRWAIVTVGDRWDSRGDAGGYVGGKPIAWGRGIGGQGIDKLGVRRAVVGDVVRSRSWEGASGGRETNPVERAQSGGEPDRWKESRITRDRRSPWTRNPHAVTLDR